VHDPCHYGNDAKQLIETTFGHARSTTSPRISENVVDDQALTPPWAARWAILASARNRQGHMGDSSVNARLCRTGYARAAYFTQRLHPSAVFGRYSRAHRQNSAERGTRVRPTSHSVYIDRPYSVVIHGHIVNAQTRRPHSGVDARGFRGSRSITPGVCGRMLPQERPRRRAAATPVRRRRRGSPAASVAGWT